MTLPAPPPEALPPEPRAPAPVLTSDLIELRARAFSHLIGEEASHRPGANPKAPPNEPAPVAAPDPLGNFVAIENEAALTSFYGALAAYAEGRFEGKLRILAYGASHTQGDFYTGYLRHYLQARFGNGGLGFLQFAQVNEWYRSVDAKVESNGFRVEHAQRKVVPEHGRFGLLGAAGLATSAHALASVERAPRAASLDLGTELELYYMNEAKGGGFRLAADGVQLLDVHTRAETPSAGYARVTLPADWQRLELRPRGNGSVRFFGGTLETAEPGIVIDTLGINGTRAANMLAWNEALWAEHVARRSPRLVSLAYGTNEAVDTKQPIAEYEANLREVLTRLQRVAPEASCLLIGPGDFPKEASGGYLPRPRLLEIIDVQRKLALEYGCGFWDTLEFMGGEGSMERWVRASPPLGAKDHIHLTSRGYVRWGMTLADALMLPHDRRLAL